jgi:hypothetical protein
VATELTGQGKMKSMDFEWSEKLISFLQVRVLPQQSVS